jgi:hypothetical protein
MLLRIGGEAVEHGFTVEIDLFFVSHYVFHADATVFADLVVRNRLFLKEPDEEGARHIQKRRRLNGRKLRILGNERKATPSRHRLQDLHKQGYGTGGQLDRLLLLGVDDAKGEGAITTSDARKTLTGGARYRDILGCGWQLAVSECGHGVFPSFIVVP